MTSPKPKCAAPVPRPRANPSITTASLILALIGLGCDHQLGTLDRGQSISGTVAYDGVSGDDFGLVGIQVAAFLTFPPNGPPHSAVTIADPDFTQPIAFELPFLRPGSYQLIAQMVDLDDPERPNLPVGGFPDFCTVGLPAAAIEIDEDRGMGGADLVIYDASGGEDPCFDQPSDLCPDPGQATLSLTVDADVGVDDLGENDVFVFGAFASWPPTGPPARFQLVTGDDLAFPVVLVENALPPGDLVVYVCLDRGGNNTTGLCDEGEDLFMVFDDGGTVTFQADTIHHLSMDMSAGDSSPVETETPPDGCLDS